MSLSPEARERLADVVDLQPTKNAELQDRWGMDSGSEVHGYLQSALEQYVYRDEDSRIRATAEAVELVGGEPVEEHRVSATPLERQLVDVLPEPDERSKSVVAVLHALRDAHDVDPGTDEVRSALQSLKRKGVVAIERRSVPTFRLAVDREDVVFEGD